ncbi:MAG TPA: glycoside hydrolase family 28 protein [Acidobacteriaceae bacterium]|nr:glycoside hydrolase family 28 protein [Acidobacteriaceae bacterium]
MNSRRRDLLKLAGGGMAATLASVPVLRAADRTSIPASNHNGIFDVRSFGAIGDGKTIDTPAVNRAIDAAAKSGGGTVLFPAGTYVCYSIHLRSYVNLLLEQGATILAAPTPANGIGGYDAPEPNVPWAAYQDYGHTHWHNSLIWGESIHDVSICGPGLIWGKGLDRGWGRSTPLAVETPGGGNKSISLKNCHNVTLKDFSILQGGWFGILATGVDNLTIDNLKIDTNRDGMDIDCCRNVRVSNCTVNSPWDDAIVPKSSFALGEPRATENVTISNCYVTGTYQLGTLLDGTFRKFPAGEHVGRTGRIKLGTESNGGFKNIAISNCVFEGCHGLALETVDGALLEDIAITNITMRDIVSAPIFLRLGSRMRGPKSAAIGQLRRVLLSNIVVSNAASQQCSILSGIPGHAVEDIKISNIFIQHQGGGTAEQAALNPPEVETQYPEPNMFGVTPAQGFYLRHVKNIDMSHIEIASLESDRRPGFMLQDVQNADFLRIKTQQGVPVFSLKDVENFGVALSPGVSDTILEQVKVKTF